MQEPFINSEHQLVKDIREMTSEQVNKIYSENGIQIIKQCDTTDIFSVKIWNNISILHIFIIILLFVIVFTFEITSRIYAS
ncbi:hypothetical protein BMW23_0463 [Bodo saltans virus]|uniref:Transmembrane protein n=1 Tax=Bodo saltans virus TaxID=2024608 RepID=A0A2H4UUL6_9VIRU|nr:hypothetical protein QJ851_gp0452 [Bodo saltans virus]ATZ80515.1 hypothetical protein BMW23_0463 [Bodo saltans virus]